MQTATDALNAGTARRLKEAATQMLDEKKVRCQPGVDLGTIEGWIKFGSGTDGQIIRDGEGKPRVFLWMILKWTPNRDNPALASTRFAKPFTRRYRTYAGWKNGVLQFTPYFLDDWETVA